MADTKRKAEAVEEVESTTTTEPTPTTPAETPTPTTPAPSTPAETPTPNPSSSDAKDDGFLNSELFKICVENLPTHSTPKEAKKLAVTLNVNCVKVKKAPHWDYAFYNFHNEEERIAAVATFDGAPYRGKKLKAYLAHASVDPMEQNNTKRRRVDPNKPDYSDKPLLEQLAYKVTPLWAEPYERQLIKKRRVLSKELKKATKDTNRLKWAQDGMKLYQGCICLLEDVIGSPVLDAYRNNSEFSVGLGLNDEITVGHLLGAYLDGVIQVVEVDACKHLSPQAKFMAKTVQTFIRSSTFPILDRQSHKGFWRCLRVRQNIGGDVMAVMFVQKTDIEEEKVNEELKKFQEHILTTAKANDINIVSIYSIHDSSLSGAGEQPAENVELLYGVPCLVETMGSLKFQIAPQAFFQVNTKAAETLMDVVRSSSDIGAETTLLDVCCGTGTIGLSLAKSVKRVIGIDICESSVINARKNAELNGISNCEFIAGKAEDTIEAVLKKSKEGSGDVFAIVDPPRSGLYSSVIKHLRKTPEIKKLIYISCNIKAAGGNVDDLCRPTSKSWKGTPFKLVKAIPVDLFPHTLHCELVLIFSRDTPAE